MEAIALDERYIDLYGKLEDRFGDNGVVSVVIGCQHEDIVEIELWAMSCRVLKRDFEYAMMDEFISICRKKRINKVVGRYLPTVKNSMVKDFYGLHGFGNTCKWRK